VIDEAGQAIEPACWIPILKAEKVVMAGDHYQLPPTIKSVEAAKEGLQTTLMEKLVELHPGTVVLLQEQYRMHNDIMGYSSSCFYNNLLTAHFSVATHLLEGECKTAGLYGYGRLWFRGKSRRNKGKQP
jgi:superfamily I DNA and/or RNA helicase